MDETNDNAEEDLVHIELCPSCGTWQIHEIISEKSKGGVQITRFDVKDVVTSTC